ncbi:MAG: pyridoxamine 5'-phosphate oxidase family protein [Pseudomonadales bacterium]|nr:pyridoxamine 5'-phosphate oxidase family protein [Pseudomonadales bacterium]
MDYVTTEKQMRAAIGNPPPAISVKKLKQFEEHSKRYLQICNLLAISCDQFEHRIKLISAKHSQISIESDNRFSVVVKDSGNNNHEFTNAPCAIYTLVAGFEESLRINGFVSARKGNEHDTTVFEISVEEHYFHCGKSIKRSGFWSPNTATLANQETIEADHIAIKSVDAFIKSSTFLILATRNSNYQMDLSPRGDPAGFLRVLDRNRVLLPERPGNKIADSLTNILSCQTVSLLALTPGSTNTLFLEGEARMVKSQGLLAPSKIQNKIPKLGIEISIKRCLLGNNIVLQDMELWNTENFVDRSSLPSLGKVLSDQMQSIGKLPSNKKGFGRVLGKVAGAASELVVQADYKKNLY